MTPDGDDQPIAVIETSDLIEVQKFQWHAQAEGLAVQVWSFIRPDHGTAASRTMWTIELYADMPTVIRRSP